MEQTRTDDDAGQKHDQGGAQDDSAERGTTTEDLVREQGEDSSDEPES